jgi:hypothetical protein
LLLRWQEWQVDGYRVDAARHVEIKWLAKLRENLPIFTIGEVIFNPPSVPGFLFTLSWQFLVGVVMLWLSTCWCVQPLELSGSPVCHPCCLFPQYVIPLDVIQSRLAAGALDSSINFPVASALEHAFSWERSMAELTDTLAQASSYAGVASFHSLRDLQILRCLSSNCRPQCFRSTESGRNLRSHLRALSAFCIVTAST